MNELDLILRKADIEADLDYSIASPFADVVDAVRRSVPDSKLKDIALQKLVEAKTWIREAWFFERDS